MNVFLDMTLIDIYVYFIVWGAEGWVNSQPKKLKWPFPHVNAPSTRKSLRRNKCSKQSKNLHNSGVDLLRVGMPKIGADPGIAQCLLNSRIVLSAKLECYSLLEFYMTLSPQLPDTLNDNRRYLIWEGGGCWALFLSVLEVCMSFVEETKNSSQPDCSGFCWFFAASTLLIETLEVLLWSPFMQTLDFTGQFYAFFPHHFYFS